MVKDLPTPEQADDSVKETRSGLRGGMDPDGKKRHRPRSIESRGGTVLESESRCEIPTWNPRVEVLP